MCFLQRECTREREKPKIRLNLCCWPQTLYPAIFTSVSWVEGSAWMSHILINKEWHSLSSRSWELWGIILHVGPPRLQEEYFVSCFLSVFRCSMIQNMTPNRRSWEATCLRNTVSFFHVVAISGYYLLLESSTSLASGRHVNFLTFTACVQSLCAKMVTKHFWGIFLPTSFSLSIQSIYVMLPSTPKLAGWPSSKLGSHLRTWR